MKMKGENTGCRADKLLKKSLWKRTNKWQQKKELVTQMRKIEKFTDVPQEMGNVFKENSPQELQEIEERRNDLLPEHQKMQKLSQKLHSLQDKKKQCQKKMVVSVHVSWCAHFFSSLIRIWSNTVSLKRVDDGGSERPAGASQA